MNDSEKEALIDLGNLGWSPKKLTKLKDKGIPDFICSENRYVELKKSHSYFIHIREDQMAKWADLLNENKRVFLYVFTREHQEKILFELTLINRIKKDGKKYE